jgi:hypothetical protein
MDLRNGGLRRDTKKYLEHSLIMKIQKMTTKLFNLKESNIFV